MAKYYDWAATLSRQTDTNGEICLVIGAKGIGKTFGLRLLCVSDYLKRKRRFCEICRTKEEMKAVKKGYFDKLQNAGYFNDYEFRVEGNTGQIRKSKNDDWQVLCYFVALTSFQTEKKRTYAGVYRFIFDEALIDRKDRYHRYLPNEFLILANILDSVSREQPDSDMHYKLYLLGNACDLSAPYLQYLGINTIPEYGYSFYRDKTVLLHYVEPWDANERKLNTLVGRMLSGNDEASMIFDNEFADTGAGEIETKTSKAKYAYTLKFNHDYFSVWIDYKSGVFYIVGKQHSSKNERVYTLTKDDAQIDYTALRRNEPFLQILNDVFYLGGLRYDSIATREKFLTVLNFLGIR